MDHDTPKAPQRSTGAGAPRGAGSRVRVPGGLAQFIGENRGFLETRIFQYHFSIISNMCALPKCIRWVAGRGTSGDPRKRVLSLV